MTALLEGVDVCYGDLQVLWSISLAVNAGEIACLLGPNGSGKSTIMNTVSGLVRPRAGTVRFDGERIDVIATHAVVTRVDLQNFILIDLRIRNGKIVGSSVDRMTPGRAGASGSTTAGSF